MTLTYLMSPAMSNQFIPLERDQPMVIPVQEWLAQDHLARFIVEIVEGLDVSALEAAYRGGGSAPYPPKMMLALLFYGYATGIFSSRALERATYELIPVIYITGNTHPDHNSINAFRNRFLGELKDLFVQLLLQAYALGVLQLGKVSLDGSKVHANASKHKAMSWDYANRLEEQLQAEVEALLQQAEAGHTEPLPGLKVMDELALRQARLQQIGAVKAELEARAQARYEQEQAAYEAKLVARRAKEQARGRKLGGRPPKPPEPGPQGKDQVNFTDPESQIMPVSGGGFEQAYNAHVGVEHTSRLIVANHASPNPNEKQELQPALDNLRQLPAELGRVNHVLTDNGFFSEANVKACEQAGLTPLIAMGRTGHHLTLEERFADPGEAPDTTDPVARMEHRLCTPEGKALYAQRKSTVEPVFGIIKHVMGFRQFLLRGLQAVQGEWNLVCIAYNLRRLYVLAG
jgi:transposase